ncbi:hypothetical protein, partial [uncultured Sutterella sp.]|uniref:hypothetical protein n=1 Tax=uncultured Sutterella sp. TaxID=286133 RepID=UPI002629A19A
DVVGQVLAEVRRELRHQIRESVSEELFSHGGVLLCCCLMRGLKESRFEALLLLMVESLWNVSI